MSINTLLDRLMCCSDALIDDAGSMAHWFELHQSTSTDLNSSLEKAAISGAQFRQVSFAFASAYQSAIESMFGVGATTAGAFCHTEKGVKKPREMRTELSVNADGQLRLNGQKSFVSGGSFASALFITALDARAAHSSSPRNVVVVKVDTSEAVAGLQANDLPSLPFVSELSHAKLDIQNVRVLKADVLPGDGYLDYIKPFRAEEDLHIFAALLGQRLRVALELKQTAVSEQLSALLCAILTMQNADRTSASTHIALAGIKASTKELFEKHDETLKTSLPNYWKAWQRDKALMSFAEHAQNARTQKAWSHFLDK